MKSDPLSRFEHLVERSLDEQPPKLDVSLRVMQTLHRPRSEFNVERELVWCGAASVLAACLAWMLLWPSLSDDVLLPLAQPFVHQVDS